MSNEIIIAIVSALGGGLITVIVTYLNNKTKRFELEYNYRKKLEERYLLNAQKHIDDVYIPLYSNLIIFRNNWTRLKKSGDFQNLKNEISKLKKFKKDLEEKGLTAFLTPEVENSFNHLLDFLFKSQDASKVRYGLISQYKMLGQEKTFYEKVPEWIGRKTINYYRILILILNFFRNISWMSVTGLIDYDFKIVLDSAPLNSKDFDDQLLKFLTDINEKIKDITLGTR
jgi:hypothetical protein